MRPRGRNEAFPRPGRSANLTGVGLFQRLLFAGIGLLAGDVALLIVLLPNALNSFEFYAMFSIAGWALVGLQLS